MALSDEIRDTLQAAFRPETLVVVDESESHRGHAGWREGGESHFAVRITSPVFAEMTRLERHRAIHEALGKGLIARLHALRLTVDG